MYNSKPYNKYADVNSLDLAEKITKHHHIDKRIEAIVDPHSTELTALRNSKIDLLAGELSDKAKDALYNISVAVHYNLKVTIENPQLCEHLAEHFKHLSNQPDKANETGAAINYHQMYNIFKSPVTTPEQKLDELYKFYNVDPQFIMRAASLPVVAQDPKFFEGFIKGLHELQEQKSSFNLPSKVATEERIQIPKWNQPQRVQFNQEEIIESASKSQSISR